MCRSLPMYACVHACIHVGRWVGMHVYVRASRARRSFIVSQGARSAFEIFGVVMVEAEAALYTCARWWGDSIEPSFIWNPTVQYANRLGIIPT